MQSYQNRSRELAAFFEQRSIELIQLNSRSRPATSWLEYFPTHQMLRLQEHGSVVLRTTVQGDCSWVIFTGRGGTAARFLGRPLPTHHLLLAGVGTDIDLFVPGDTSLRFMIIETTRFRRPGLRLISADEHGDDETAGLVRLFRPTPARTGTCRETLREQVLSAYSLSTDFDSAMTHGRRVEAVVSASRIIEMSIAQPVAMRDLAKRCGVAERTLEYGFRQVYDSTPLEFVKHQRLSRCRRLLLNSVIHATVSQAARELGFTHMGQFSADYRRLFGEAPSMTLARRRLADEALVRMECTP